MVLWTLVQGERQSLSLALVLSCMGAVVELVPFYLLYLSLDVVFRGTANADRLLELAGWMAVTLFIKYALYSTAYWLSHRSAYSILESLRKSLLDCLISAPMSLVSQESSGSLRKTILNDVERLEQFIAHHTVEVAAAISAPLCCAIFLIGIDYRIALAALIPVPLAYIIQNRFMRDFVKLFEKYDLALRALNTASIEYLRNIAVMKAYGQDAQSFRQIHDSLNNYNKLIINVTQRTVPGWSAFMTLLSANVFTILPVSSWLYTNGTISMSQWILSLILGTGMLKPLYKVIRFSSEIREISICTNRIHHILQWPQYLNGNATDKTILGSVTVSSLGFSYSDKKSLQNLNFHLPEGSFTAIIGASGAGKSTLLHLLAGLVPAQAGEIFIGGVALESLSDEQRSRTISIATQDIFLFHGTLRENLHLANPHADDMEIWSMLEMAQAASLVSALPDGLDTMLSERGLRLSMGERQRIALARALLASTPILLLDEVTAFADPMTEQAFYESLAEISPRKTILVVTHHLHTTRNADQILVMEKGQVVHQGTHEDLLRNNLFYSQHWHHQDADGHIENI